MKFLYKPKAKARFAIFFLFIFIAEILSPVASYAITGGPSQPEMESFAPVGMSEMVDLFTGDMNYNIPLMDVDGYPLNISYKAGPGMDEEASWVGLGWSLNPGSINRSLRGLPDDFNGDKVDTKVYQKPNWNVNLSMPTIGKLFGYEVLGKKFNVSMGFNLAYNNYSGFNLEATLQNSRERPRDPGDTLKPPVNHLINLSKVQ